MDIKYKGDFFSGHGYLFDRNIIARQCTNVW